MKDLFSEFCQDLTLPQEVLDNLRKPRDNQELKNFALSLPTLAHPDTSILSGRLLIYLNIKSCPKKIEDYTNILSEVLRKEIIDFMDSNKELLYINAKLHNGFSR